MKGMEKSFRMPDLGEGIHEAEVLAVLVSAGDSVKEGDVILELETDKAAVEIPSPFTGTVKEVLVRAGDMVKVGAVLITFTVGEEATLAGKVTEKKTPERPPAPAERPLQEVLPGRKKGPVPASPATRRLARELEVDLEEAVPTGPGGLVTAEDVRALAQRREKQGGIPEKPVEKTSEPIPFVVPAPPLPDFSRWGPVERIPFRSIRRATAKQMALSWSQIPHVNSVSDVDVTKLEAFRQKHKAEVEDQGGNLTLTVFALKAVATALRKNPVFNATLDAAAGEIVVKQYYHIGVAVSTENGLVVPVVRNVDRKSIVELSVELNDLVQRTRTRKVTIEEMQGGTFTITNVGPRGGGYFTPIINYPQVAIMGMGAARMRPVVIQTGGTRHEIAPRLVMPLILCIDHRVLDGADAMRFMQVVIDVLKDPDELLMTMI
jgi:pyruvate dehydrogenase E2 component (dihydrolipoamide acetyltransferase)